MYASPRSLDGYFNPYGTTQTARNKHPIKQNIYHKFCVKSLLAGAFQYNGASRQIIWKLSDLENKNDNYRLGFEIQFTPDASLLSKLAPLLTNLKYFAFDALSGEEQYFDMPNLSSNLDFDRLNRGQGEIKLP